jgi:DNA excision repair protein ERCC-4
MDNNQSHLRDGSSQSVKGITPITIIIDTREQAPFSFTGFRADAKHKQPVKDPVTGKNKKDHLQNTIYQIPDLYVPITRAGLPTGDYSIEGHTSEIAVERKSLNDLFSTLSSGRERFERELQRLSTFKVAHIVIESDWNTIISSPPARSSLSPKSIFRSINAWQQEFPTIHWDLMGGRALAEHKTLRILERFHTNLERELERERQAEKRNSMSTKSDTDVT